VLSAVNFDDQMPLAADEIGVVPADRLLSDKSEAIEPAVAQAAPQDRFRGVEETRRDLALLADFAFFPRTAGPSP
jgi:hypothetical protein